MIVKRFPARLAPQQIVENRLPVGHRLIVDIGRSPRIGPPAIDSPAAAAYCRPSHKEMPGDMFVASNMPICERALVWPTDMRSFGHRSRTKQMGSRRGLRRQAVIASQYLERHELCHSHLRERPRSQARRLQAAASGRDAGMSLGEAFMKPSTMIIATSSRWRLRAAALQPIDGAVLLAADDKRCRARHGAASMTCRLFVPPARCCAGNCTASARQRPGTCGYWPICRRPHRPQDWQEDRGRHRAPAGTAYDGHASTMGRWSRCWLDHARRSPSASDSGMREWRPDCGAGSSMVWDDLR